MKYAEIHLPYYKQGDDLAHCLKGRSAPEALEEHAVMLEEAAAQLRGIKEALLVDTVREVVIEAGTHTINIEGPDAFIDDLISKDLACLPYWDEDEDADIEDVLEDCSGLSRPVAACRRTNRHSLIIFQMIG